MDELEIWELTGISRLVFQKYIHSLLRLEIFIYFTNCFSYDYHTFCGLILFWRCDFRDDVLTKIEKEILRWFKHIERMDEWQIHKEIMSDRVG